MKSQLTNIKQQYSINKLSTIIALGASMSLLFTGCRKDLCFNHFRSVTVTTSYEQVWERNNGTDVRSLWDDELLGRTYEDFLPSPCTMVTCLIYNKDAGTMDKVYLNNTTENIPLPSGTNSLMFFNNETDVMEFYNLEDRTTALCTTVPRSRSSYRSTETNEVTVAEPEMMYGCYLSDVEDVAMHEVRNLTAHMTPLVFTYVIRIEFEHGLEYVSLARGGVTGMARGVFLRDGGTTAETATILFDDCEVIKNGLVTYLNSFGPPNYIDADFNGPAPSRSLKASSTGKQMLNLEIRLSNGTTKYFYIDISDQIASMPTGGLVLVDKLRIEDEEGSGGSGNSAFDVTMEGWNVENHTLTGSEESED
jgi:hypothetical protein